MANKYPIDSMNFLYDIMNDLYGKNAAMAKELEQSADPAVPLTPVDTPDIEEALKAAGLAGAPKATEAQSAAEPATAPEASAEVAVEPVPKLPPFDSFWRVADDTVDWTDALAHRESPDGLSDPELWTFYHEQAEKVLNGNLSAYVAVLKRANPLNDLLPYAGGFHVKAIDADTLSVTFETLPDYMQGNDDETKRYLAGISLRAARDLLALLPVFEAQIHVTTMGLPSLDVTYTRQEVQKVRFSFIDPVEFCVKCGGEFK